MINLTIRTRPSSITTRIKTHKKLIPFLLSSVRDHLPLQQGLRHLDSIFYWMKFACTRPLSTTIRIKTKCQPMRNKCVFRTRPSSTTTRINLNCLRAKVLWTVQRAFFLEILFKGVLKQISFKEIVSFSSILRNYQ